MIEDGGESTGMLLPIASGRVMARYAGGVLRERWSLVAATTVVASCASAVGLIGPLAIGWITQAVVDHRPPEVMVWPVIVLVLGAAVGAAAAWASAVLLARLVLPPVARLREDVVADALALPLDTVERAGTGDLVARVSGDVELVTDAAQGALGDFVSAALTIVVTLAGLAALDWRFALAGLLAVPIQAYTLRWYLRTSRPIYASGRLAEARRGSALLSAFSALPTIRAFRAGTAQFDRTDGASLDAMEWEFRATRVATRFYGRLNAAEFIGLAAILAVAFLLVRAGLTTVGAATAAALFFAGLFNPINTVLGVFDQLQQAAAGLARLVGITAAAPAAVGTDAGPHRPFVLEASGVRFAYCDADVVRGVDVRIAPGEHVAVVGASGSGKSTLATLIAGLRQPGSGEVLAGGVPLQRILPAELHGAIMLVTQETHVFAGTIADNLRLARPDAPAERLVDVLEEVGALGWASELPDGLQTAVGGGGHAITASQAQQLALARVILADPAVIILDEATAEAGSDAARQLDAAGRRATQGRAALIVAHRLSQAAEADRILVMHDGVVVERGSHERLVAANGPYARLWATWSRGATTPPSDA